MILASAVSPRILLLSLFGGILLIIGLTRPSVNSKQEMEYVERLF